MTATRDAALGVAMLVADLEIGGIQSMVEGLGRSLGDGFRVSYVCFDRVGAVGERLLRDGYRVTLVKRRPGLDGTLGRRLRREFERLGARVVHAHNRTAMFYAVVARGLSSPFGLVYTEHDRSFPDRLRVRALHAILSRRIDQVATVCDAVRDAIVRTEGFPAARVRTIPNGIPEPPPEPKTEQARREVRAELDLDEDAPLLLAVGHLTEVKDHAFLLRALARIEGGRRPHLAIAGDGPLRSALEAQASEAGLSGRVRFLGYRTDVDRLLKASDVLVMPSRSEGLSMVLIEASARAIPIVATRVGGNPEVVVDGESGWLVDHGDERALADAISQAVLDESARRERGAAARRRFEERFRIERMADAYAATYRSVSRPSGAEI